MKQEQVFWNLTVLQQSNQLLLFLSNVDRLDNNIIPLEAGFQSKQIQNCCLGALTETWFSDNDSQGALTGYSTIRCDRNNRTTHKNQVGGLIIYINDKTN
mgnify:CR=1 FL=1